MKKKEFKKLLSEIRREFLEEWDKKNDGLFNWTYNNDRMIEIAINTSLRKK